jgi:hypothetical protein
MATLREERARLQFLEERGHGDEKVHVIFVEEEAKKRIENKPEGDKPPKTQFRMETDDPAMYSRFNAQKDRWFRLLNKSVACDLMCRLWERPSDQQLQQIAQGEEPEIETGCLGDA